MANKGWSKRFDEPIVLDDGTTLATLQEAIAGKLRKRRRKRLADVAFHSLTKNPCCAPYLKKPNNIRLSVIIPTVGRYTVVSASVRYADNPRARPAEKKKGPAGWRTPHLFVQRRSLRPVTAKAAASISALSAAEFRPAG
jgi:hypothetical protein